MQHEINPLFYCYQSHIHVVTVVSLTINFLVGDILDLFVLSFKYVQCPMMVHS